MIMMALFDDFKSIHHVFLLQKGKMPIDGENFEDLMREFNEKIVPRLVHWNHPRFAAYYPSGSSYAGILGEMLCVGTNQLGFSWVNHFPYH